MSTQQPTTLTLSEALSQGYTHFCMILGMEDTYEVYPLTKEMLDQKIYDAFSPESNAGIYGAIPHLCDKNVFVPAFTVEDIGGVLADYAELQYEAHMSPEALRHMEKNLKNSDLIKQATELINKEMSENYKSYTDTPILVTLD